MKLFIDSSTNYLYLAIVDEDEIATLVRSSKNDHSETLVDTLKNFLDTNHILIDEIDSIYVGRGPGSYTGVRISGTIAKVLALIKKIKLYSFSTLDLLMVSALTKENIDETYYLAKIIAKKNYSYYKTAKVEKQDLHLLSDDAFTNDEALDKFTNYQLIEPTESLFKKPQLSLNLLKYQLYKEEDVYSYVPNYLRSEING